MKKSRFILIPVFVSILTFGSCKKANAEGNNQTLAAAGSGTAGTPFNASAYSLESPEYRERALAFLEKIQESETCVHGDLHIGNIITDGNRTLWIDIGQFGYGAPD